MMVAPPCDQHDERADDSENGSFRHFFTHLVCMRERLIDCDLRDSGLVTRIFRGPARARSQSICSSECVISNQEACFYSNNARRFVALPLRVCGICRCHKREDCGCLFGAKCARKESLAILALPLVAFRGENRFWIGAGNFAYRNPAKSADKCTD